MLAISQESVREAAPDAGGKRNDEKSEHAENLDSKGLEAAAAGSSVTVSGNRVRRRGRLRGGSPERGAGRFP